MPKGFTIHRNGFSGAVKLVQQKLLADGRIVPVLMCGGCGAKWREVEDDRIRAIAQAFYDEGDRRRKDAWTESGKYVGHEWSHKIADRILSGLTACEIAATEVQA